MFRCTRRCFQKRSSICFSVSSVIKELTIVIFMVMGEELVDELLHLAVRQLDGCQLIGQLRYVSGCGIRTAGAESDTAVGAAKLGVQAEWISRLGADEFGQYIRNQIRAEGVDYTGVKFDPDHRTGVMFKQTGRSASGWNRIPAAASTPSVQAIVSMPVCWRSCAPAKSGGMQESRSYSF